MEPAPELPDSVRSAYESHEGHVLAGLLRLRELLFEVARDIPEVETITEELKWGQPSFLTQPRTGSTIRIDAIRETDAGIFAMYFICTTNLVGRFREQFGDTFVYEKDRALIFESADTLPETELRECIAMALTYHLHK